MISRREVEYQIALLSEFHRIMDENGSEIADTYDNKLNTLYDLYANRIKRVN
jgi:hypothetical protein